MREIKSKIEDQEFLAIVASERTASVGFEHDSVLAGDRERALRYRKGDMAADMPNLPNRSSAVSSSGADAVETLLPDLMEIFTGGDDVVTFDPVSEHDEEAAKQETEFVRQVMFSENDGFTNLYAIFKDALEAKVGIGKASWIKNPVKPEYFEGKTLIEIAMLEKDGTVSDAELGEPNPDGEQTFNFTLTNEEPGGSVKIDVFPPEDFTVAADTIKLADATYCAVRSRPRKQDLIAQGYDRDVVEALPPYGQTDSQTVQLARDTAGEHYDRMNAVGMYNLSQVEIVEHYIRVDAAETGQPQIWRVVTGGGETTLIEKECVDEIPFFYVTPYPVPHRFYGESVMDRMIQNQQIDTALLRMMLDSGYFALNQRYEVAQSGQTEDTIKDLMRLEPGLPVRVKTSGTVTPLQAGALNFDTFQAMEFVATMGEKRTGIVRNAQGLNPDSLHDTAGGMEKLMMSAQMRMRLIARNFAETGVKDCYLLIHGLLRKHAHKANSRLGGKWVPVDCSKWGERRAMNISVGLGSAGRAQELAAMTQVLAIQKEIVTAQGGAQGPVVTLPNIYAAAIRLVEKAGEKAADQFFTDPATAQQQPAKPDPGAAEAQAKAQADQAAAQQKQAELQAKTQGDQERLMLEGMKAHDADEVARLKMQQDKELAQAQIDSAERMASREMAWKMRIEEAKLENALQIAMISAKTTMTTVEVKAMAEAARADVDIELQARGHEHEAQIAIADHEHQADMADKAAEAQPEPKDDE